MAIHAAKEAEGNKAYADSAHLYERIVDHVEDRCKRAAVLSELGKAHFFDGETRRGQRYLEQGIEGLEQCGRTSEAAGFRLWLGRTFWLQGRPDLARREYESARATLEPIGLNHRQGVIGALFREAGVLRRIQQRACLGGVPELEDDHPTGVRLGVDRPRHAGQMSAHSISSFDLFILKRPFHNVKSRGAFA